MEIILKNCKQNYARFLAWKAMPSNSPQKWSLPNNLIRTKNGAFQKMELQRNSKPSPQKWSLQKISALPVLHHNRTSAGCPHGESSNEAIHGLWNDKCRSVSTVSASMELSSFQKSGTYSSEEDDSRETPTNLERLFSGNLMEVPKKFESRV